MRALLRRVNGWLLCAVVVALCGCLQSTEQLGLRLDAGQAEPDASTPACQPASCEAQGKDCGQVEDGCGGLLWCGTCAAGQACGADGVTNVCGCAPELCDVPLRLAARVVTRGIALTWLDRSSREVGYELERRRGDGGFTFVAGPPADATAFVDETARTGNRYAYRVRARLASTVTRWSSVAEVELPERSFWHTTGGNVQQTGENRVEYGVPPLTLLWDKSVGGVTGPLVVENGRAFTKAWLGSYSAIMAFDTSTGAVLWTLPFYDSWASACDPAVFDGTVYFQLAVRSPGSKVYAVDAVTGAVKWSAPVESQGQRVWSPIVVDGRLYTSGGAFGGLYGFDVATGAQQFFTGLQQYDEWSPAFKAGLVYGYAGGEVTGHDPVTGAVVWSRRLPFSWAGYSMRTMPVAGDALVYVISRPTLYALSASTGALVWSETSTNFAGTPAYSNGVVYGIAGGRLEARDGATGALQWRFEGDGNLAGQPVLAAGHAYVTSLLNQAYVVDLSTHQQVWSGQESGPMAIAEGKVFFSSVTVRAYALTR